MEPPSIVHPSAPTGMGRDVLSRTLEGVKGLSCWSAFRSPAIALVAGIIFGTLSRVFRRDDRIVMTIVDIFLAFPSLLRRSGWGDSSGTGWWPVHRGHRPWPCAPLHPAASAARS